MLCAVVLVSLNIEWGQTRAVRLFGVVVEAPPACSEHLGVDSALMYWQYPCCGAETCQRV